MRKVRTPEGDMRPLIDIPRWDGKLVLAGIFIVGYYGLVFSMARIGLPAENKEIVRDAMLTLGPPIGVIVGALFKFTAADERQQLLQTDALRTAITTPSSNAENGMRDAVEEGVTAGLDQAEPVKVVATPLAADGRPREWLDEPAPPAPGTYEGPDLPPADDVDAPEDPTWPN